MNDNFILRETPLFNSCVSWSGVRGLLEGDKLFIYTTIIWKWIWQRLCGELWNQLVQDGASYSDQLPVSASCHETTVAWDFNQPFQNFCFKRIALNRRTNRKIRMSASSHHTRHMTCHVYVSPPGHVHPDTSSRTLPNAKRIAGSLPDSRGRARWRPQEDTHRCTSTRDFCPHLRSIFLFVVLRNILWSKTISALGTVKSITIFSQFSCQAP